MFTFEPVVMGDQNTTDVISNSSRRAFSHKAVVCFDRNFDRYLHILPCVAWITQHSCFLVNLIFLEIQTTVLSEPCEAPCTSNVADKLFLFLADSLTLFLTNKLTVFLIVRVTLSLTS